MVCAALLEDDTDIRNVEAVENHVELVRDHIAVLQFLRDVLLLIVRIVLRDAPFLRALPLILYTHGIQGEEMNQGNE